MNEETKTPHVSEDTQMYVPEENDTVHHEEPIANGPVILLLVVLLIAILGGMYYWFMMLETNEVPMEETITRPSAEENNEPESTTAEAQADAMTVMSSSDEINAIEADLETTDLNSLDTEMQAIENELNSI